jgi:hypothetical protein
MAGLAPDAAHFFKFLFVLVLYTFAMTLFVGSSFSVLPIDSQMFAEFPACLHIPQWWYCHSVIGAI